MRIATKGEALTIPPPLQELVGRAARVTGKTATDFVLDAARRAAKEALLDRTVFTVDPRHAQNKRLVKTMRTPAPWD